MSKVQLVKALFQVNRKTKFQSWDTKGGVPAPGYELELSAVYDQTDPEKEKYFNATPSGTLRMSVLNKTAADFFEPGDQVYLTFEQRDQSVKTDPESK